jgi:hypothetical protein
MSGELREKFCGNFKISAPENCWLWAGRRTAAGYGSFYALGEGRAYRVAWILFQGQIPKGKWVLHRCNQKLCVNPNHLYLGSREDNTRDMIQCGIIKTKLAPHQVLEIRELAGPPATAPGTGVSKIQVALAEKFGVSRVTISRIQRRAGWRWLV